MSPARGPSSAQLNREYPHQVEFIIPPMGLGKRLDAMIAAARQLGAHVQQAKDRTSQLPREVHSTRFCFKDPELADRFHQQFGGERITMDARLKRRW